MGDPSDPLGRPVDPEAMKVKLLRPTMNIYVICAGVGSIEDGFRAICQAKNPFAMEKVMLLPGGERIHMISIDNDEALANTNLSFETLLGTKAIDLYQYIIEGKLAESFAKYPPDHIHMSPTCRSYFPLANNQSKRCIKVWLSGERQAVPVGPLAPPLTLYSTAS